MSTLEPRASQPSRSSSQPLMPSTPSKPFATHPEPLSNPPVLRAASIPPSRLSLHDFSVTKSTSIETASTRPKAVHMLGDMPSSPTTTAAAMSLGTLAAAASFAAAAETSRPPAVYPLPYLPQRSSESLKTREEQHTNLNTQQPLLLPLAPSGLQRPEPALKAEPMPQVPPVSSPSPGDGTAQGKGTNATPVAPAPSSSMHPSQQHSVSTHPNGKPKQRRYRANEKQLSQLVARFNLNPSPSSAELHELAVAIAMPPQSVVLWFKNRRARVPQKKAEKALNAKRREGRELLPPLRTSEKATVEPKIRTELSHSALRRSGSFTDQAAAASLAEMAMDPVPSVQMKMGVRQAGRNITNQENLTVGRAESFPARSPSRSPPPLYRPKAEHVVPYDTNLVKRLGSNANGLGAGFVQAVGTTPCRRPRVLPPTPRLFSQKEYRCGDKVEVLETSKGICRAWYSATVIGRAGPRELSLGASAAGTCDCRKGEGTSKVVDSSKERENNPDIEGRDADGGDSPRTVRSPAASPTPPVAKVRYTVEYVHRFDGTNKTKLLQDEVLASRIRPAAPFSLEASLGEWRPEAGEAVEVLLDGAWFVAVTQTFVVRKGYMVSFENGDVEWVRRPRLRPYQIWRGGDAWVTKTKPPLPVVRKSVGLSVTHPPGGKRKHASSNGSTTGGGGGGGDGKDGRETRGKSKRAKSMSVDRSGPNGLPEGWRMDYMRVAAADEVRGQEFYIAPDGHKLRSLKEAERYVKMMGPA